jgi:hypothetical protein
MRLALLLVPAGLLVAAGILVSSPVRAQEGTKRDELHFGAGSCAAQACHGGGDTNRAEYKTWATRDKHSGAFAVLGNELGKRIGARLGIEPTEAPECLNCHGTVGVRTADTFDMADGVSCELCHGGAQQWLGPHAAPGWKEKTAAQKEALGLRDLSTPAKRAAMCAECHVGAPGRDITHEIMAAGHPPLVFDAAKFMHDMPPHWKDEADLGVATWVEGQRANALALLGRVRRAAESARDGLDWTVFDCYGCHHPIYTGSVYEKRESARPGALALDAASLRLFLIGAGDPDALEGIRDPLAQGLADDDLRLVARRAGEAAATLRDQNAVTDAAAIRKRLDKYLAEIEAGRIQPPRGEMQQLACAAHTFARDRGTEAFGAAYRALDEALAPGTAYDPAACAALARRALGE